jgi:hypothetical protein
VYDLMVGRVGIEPTTNGLRVRRTCVYNQLLSQKVSAILGEKRHGVMRVPAGLADTWRAG